MTRPAVVGLDDFEEVHGDEEPAVTRSTRARRAGGGARRRDRAAVGWGGDRQERAVPGSSGFCRLRSRPTTAAAGVACQPLVLVLRGRGGGEVGVRLRAGRHAARAAAAWGGHPAGSERSTLRAACTGCTPLHRCGRAWRRVGSPRKEGAGSRQGRRGCCRGRGCGSTGRLRLAIPAGIRRLLVRDILPRQAAALVLHAAAAGTRFVAADAASGAEGGVAPLRRSGGGGGDLVQLAHDPVAMPQLGEQIRVAARS